MAVDVEEAGAVLGLMDDMGVPDLVVEGFRRHGFHSRMALAWTDWQTRSAAREHRDRRAEKAPGQASPVIHVEEAHHGRDEYALPAFGATGRGDGGIQRRKVAKPAGR
jgi:hypothetical protein